jgi:hypothetical protein
MIGFIITRHVNSVSTNQYWIESIKQIRLYHPMCHIVIIDDNSNEEYLNSNDVDLTNCTIIQSTFLGRGEILAYYYYYTNYKEFHKVIILHDSTFIQTNLDHYINQVSSVQFIWKFKSVSQNIMIESKQIKLLSNCNELVSLYRQRHLWTGCFGVMTIITYDFLKLIVEKYNLFILLEHINCRLDRMAFERVFSVICHNENKNLIKRSSVLGSIHRYIKLGYTFNEYIKNKKQNKLPIIKVWTGR